MDAKTVQKERIALFRKQARFEQTDRLPYFSTAVTWKVLDAGIPLSKALVDSELMEKCVRHFLENYPVDGLLDYGIRNQFPVTEALGKPGYYYYTDEAVGVHDHAHCSPETLLDFAKDPARYTWETILPKKYGEDWKTIPKANWEKAFDAYIDYVIFIIHIGNVTKKEYGIPSLAPNNPMNGTISFGIEELLANLLGIRNLSVAMRRDAGLVEEFVRVWDETHIDPMVEKIRKGKGREDEKYCFDASILMLAQNILNPKQFEKLYWPSLKKLLDAYRDKEMNVRIFAEGSILRYADYFRDYPKGLLTFHIEQDDPFEFRKALPNAAIMGGLTTDLLANGTKEDCIRRAEELREGIGEGLILSENKMLSYRNDANPENYKALLEHVTGVRMSEITKSEDGGFEGAGFELFKKREKTSALKEELRDEPGKEPAGERETNAGQEPAENPAGKAENPEEMKTPASGTNPYASYPDGLRKFEREIIPFYMKPMKNTLMPLILQILRDG